MLFYNVFALWESSRLRSSSHEKTAWTAAGEAAFSRRKHRCGEASPPTLILMLAPAPSPAGIYLTAQSKYGMGECII